VVDIGAIERIYEPLGAWLAGEVYGERALSAAIAAGYALIGMSADEVFWCRDGRPPFPFRHPFGEPLDAYDTVGGGPSFVRRIDGVGFDRVIIRYRERPEYHMHHSYVWRRDE
jgi:hypothetical protein